MGERKSATETEQFAVTNCGRAEMRGIKQKPAAHPAGSCSAATAPDRDQVDLSNARTSKEAVMFRSLRPMPEELVERMYEEFKQDKDRWAEFAKREFSKNEVEERPTRPEIVKDFVREKLGPDHGYWVASIIIRIREDMHRA